MPQCATCDGYISSDFARVFGDNDRIVRSCLSCHGNRPKHFEAEDSAEAMETVEAVETAQTTETALDDERRADSTAEYDVTASDAVTEWSSAADEFDEFDEEYMDDIPADADAPVAASVGGRSPFGFLRSVFLR